WTAGTTEGSAGGVGTLIAVGGATFNEGDGETDVSGTVDLGRSESLAELAGLAPTRGASLGSKRLITGASYGSRCLTGTMLGGSYGSRGCTLGGGAGLETCNGSVPRGARTRASDSTGGTGGFDIAPRSDRATVSPVRGGSTFSKAEIAALSSGAVY